MTRVPANRFVVFLLVSACGFAWDLYSKDVVFVDLGYPAGTPNPLVAGQHEVFEPRPNVEGESRFYLRGWTSFRLFTSFNHGALWGVGQGYSKVFAVLSVLAAVGIMYWLFVHGAARSLWLTISLAFIMAGTLGNLYDRLGWHEYLDREGETIYAVRDFLLLTFGDFHWPVFNFADTFLVTGASMLVLQSFFIAEPERSKPANEAVRNEPKTAAAAGSADTPTER